MKSLLCLLLVFQLVLAKNWIPRTTYSHLFHKFGHEHNPHSEYVYSRQGHYNFDTHADHDHPKPHYQENHHHQTPQQPAGFWLPLRHQPNFVSYDLVDSGPYAGGVHNPKLLTDGSVLVHNVGRWITREIWKLTPDRFGSYVNGSWSQVASLPEDYKPLWHGSAVLPDGRVVFVGGLYNGWTGNPAWTSTGAIYDPVKDTWTSIPPPDFFIGAGDCATVVLEDGRLMVQDASSDAAALLDPKTLQWTKTGSGKYDINSQEGWTLLPNGKVLTVDADVLKIVRVSIRTDEAGVGPFDGFASVSSFANGISPPAASTGAVPSDPTACNSVSDLSGKIAVYQRSCSSVLSLANIETAGAVAGIQISDIGPAQIVIGNPTSAIYLCSISSKDGSTLQAAILDHPNMTISIVQPVVQDLPANSELYDPKTGKWSSAGSTISTLPDPTHHKLGPLILRPDGTVVAFGGFNGNTSIYDIHRKRWTVGPNFPVDPELGQIGMPDGSGVLLPNGNVLVSATVGFEYKTFIFEFDGKHFHPQPVFPNGNTEPGSNVAMMLLPTGQVMAVDQTNDVEIYTPGERGYSNEWRPVIYDSPKEVKVGGTYRIEGIRFNGMSQASLFGGSYQGATNYPLVRITNKKTKHVFYCRTHDHSFMGVASLKIVSTYFDVLQAEEGESILEVVANGIPSQPIQISVKSNRSKKTYHYTK